MKKRTGFGFGCGKPGCPVCGNGGIADTIDIARSMGIANKIMGRLGLNIPGEGSFLGAEIFGLNPSEDDGFPFGFSEMGPFSELSEMMDGGFPGGPRVISISSKEELGAVLKGLFGRADGNISSAIEDIFGKDSRDDSLGELPEDIRENYAKFKTVLGKGEFVLFEHLGDITINGVKLKQELQFKKADPAKDKDESLEKAKVMLTGVYAKTLSEIGNVEIAKLIPKAINLQREIESNLDLQKEGKLLYARLQRSVEDSKRALAYKMRQGWPELYTGGNVLEVRQNNLLEEVKSGQVPAFVLFLNEELQEDVNLGDHFGGKIFDLQASIAEAEKQAEETRTDFYKNIEKRKKLEYSLSVTTETMEDHFATNPVKSCQVLGVAVDPESSDSENETPLLLVEETVAREIFEIPRNIKESMIKRHLAGDRMPVEYQKALGIDQVISQIEEKNAEIEEAMKSL